MVRFETCNRYNALKFLQQFYPGCSVRDTQNSAAPVLDLVEEDIVRIPDPSLHSDGAITPSTNWDERRRDEVMRKFREFHENVMAEARQGS